MSFQENTEEQDERKGISRRCYESAPKRVIRIITRLLEKDESEFAVRSAAEAINEFFDESLGELFVKALKPAGDERRNQAIVSFLAKNEYPPIVESIVEVVSNGAFSPSDRLFTEQQFVAAASALLQANPKRLLD